MLRADKVSVDIGRMRILSEIDATAAPGAVTAIVGPNGSGKTTLLRALTGEIAARGNLTLDGVRISPRNAAALAVRRGVLPQASHLAFPFTVLEVVRIGHRAGRFAGRPDLPLHALDRVGLRHMADRFYQDLSGGEQQRVQLARVMAQIWEPVGQDGPNWLFLDEPVSSLDIGQQLAIMRLARDFATRGGGVVTVMHDLNLTAMFADSVMVLHNGKVAATGTPRDVLTSAILSRVYDCNLQVSTPPPHGIAYILPQASNGTAAP
ncbi:iron complex transport system ATP-binding protein [Roseovarius azorensis]|uniref:Iron complex transport system ATP-binding protein n=1 Tax=Roseovarius azorensis TaxID=1287727 RepID=A0A1H7NXP6_9RHOB|nr:heme ABC transporter ATP-binding protein [Roseovarius azorensis]SEL28380.1 iron complex transport system ATP-binding protein [Roseovarius azorensis]